MLTGRQISRLGVIGDVHCEDASLAQVLDFFSKRTVERVLCVGDIADGLASLDACCELLRQHDVTVVVGNHDRWLLANQMRDLPDATALGSVSSAARRYLESLPRTVDIATVRGPLQLCHGLGTNDMGSVGPDDYGYALESNTELQELLRERRYRFVVCGHTHRRMVRRFPNLVVVNVGTLNRQHDPCCVIIDFKLGHAELFDLDDEGLVVGQETNISLTEPA